MAAEWGTERTVMILLIHPFTLHGGVLAHCSEPSHPNILGQAADM